MPLNKKCMEYEQEDLFPVERYPHKLTRWSPKHRTMRFLTTFINDRIKLNDSMLEFGCGPSSFYLNQLKFKHYVAIETFEPAVDIVHKYCPNVTVLDKWVDIPVRKYKWLLVDSKVGGDVPLGKWSRYAPLTYAYDNNLIAKNAIMIVHDYNRIKQSNDKPNSPWGKRHRNWNETIKKQGWKLIDEILVGRYFGIYGR